MKRTPELGPPEKLLNTLIYAMPRSMAIENTFEEYKAKPDQP